MLLLLAVLLLLGTSRRGSRGSSIDSIHLIYTQRQFTHRFRKTRATKNELSCQMADVVGIPPER